MKCIYCGFEDSKVVDSRSTIEINSIRRRRECLSCGKRFTTYETVESTSVLVTKNNGSIQPFDKNKIINGVIKACEKRPVFLTDIEEIAQDIEKELNDGIVKEVKSEQIGEMVLQRLKPLDNISYIRFASVFKKFNSVNDYVNFLSMM